MFDFSTWTLDQVNARMAEINTELRSESADLETLEQEIAALEARKNEINANVERRNRLQQRALAASPANVITPTGSNNRARQTNTIEEIRSSRRYVDAYAEAIRTGDDSFNECRAILTELAPNDADYGSPMVPVPTIVEDRIRTAWEKDDFLRYVRRTHIAGILEVGFEIEGDEAVIHLEGTEAPDEEELSLGVVTIKPSNIKKWIRISDETADLKGEAFLEYVYNELGYRIIKKASATIIAKILAAPTTSTSTKVGVAQITQALGVNTVLDAEAEVTSEVDDNDLVIICNRKTKTALKKIKNASGDNVVDPFDGLSVITTSALPSYDDAEEDDPYLIVGDPAGGITANLPRGEQLTFKIDDTTEAEADLIKIVGRLYMGAELTAPYRFCTVLKAAAEEDEGDEGAGGE